MQYNCQGRKEHFDGLLILHKMKVSYSACADWSRALQKHKTHPPYSSSASPAPRGSESELSFTARVKFTMSVSVELPGALPALGATTSLRGRQLLDPALAQHTAFHRAPGFLSPAEVATVLAAAEAHALEHGRAADGTM